MGSKMRDELQRDRTLSLRCVHSSSTLDKCGAHLERNKRGASGKSAM